MYTLFSCAVAFRQLSIKTWWWR